MGNDLEDMIHRLEQEAGNKDLPFGGWLHERDSAWVVLQLNVRDNAPPELIERSLLGLEHAEQGLRTAGYYGRTEADNAAFDLVGPVAAPGIVEAAGGMATLGAAALIHPGRFGGPEHRAVVNDVKADIQSRQLTPSDKEYKVNTPGGHKEYRFADVTALDVNGNPVEFHQVGKITESGQPIAREADALADIYELGGYDIPVFFHPYYK